jgi:hypothetical protein
MLPLIGAGFSRPFNIETRALQQEKSQSQQKYNMTGDLSTLKTEYYMS